MRAVNMPRIMVDLTKGKTDVMVKVIERMHGPEVSRSMEVVRLDGKRLRLLLPHV